ncbi:MAG: hypothetical protein K6B69_03225 [Lachnospiraceae bacterium]|nr:hypothetical protein [Lachnospiraceae bacterium]
MAEAVLNEEQRALLERLRRKLGHSSDLERPEEDLRLYQVLGDFAQDTEAGKEKKDLQKDGDMHALLRELKAYIMRIGPEDDLYDDALDVLQAIAPEAVGEARRSAEQADVQKAKDMEQMTKLAQERNKETMDRLSSGLFHYEDKDGNFIPDDVDEELKNAGKKKEKDGAERQDGQNRRKMEPEEVDQLLKGENKEKRRPGNPVEPEKVKQKQKNGFVK